MAAAGMTAATTTVSATTQTCLTATLATPRIALSVTAIDDSVPGIRSLRLAAPDRAPLPSYTPGSHLVVDLPPAGDRRRANAYSLTGDGAHPTTYAISVLRRDPADGGEGGSVWMHGLCVGDVVTSTPPRSAFAPVQLATRHLLVGAGIGITPLVSHLRSAIRWGREVELIYLCRDGVGAYVDELAGLGGDRVTVFDERASALAHLEQRLARQRLGSHLYVCGPGGFMDHVVDSARALGWPASRVHTEPFGLADLDPGEPFTVGVAGATHDVAAGVSLLEALEEAGHKVANLCRQGVCGECRLTLDPARSTGVLHRDLFLTDADKAAGDAVMACVSRAVPDHESSRSHLEVVL